MNIRALPALCLLASLMSVIGCSGKKPQEPVGGDTTELRLEPLPDEKAELIALWLADELEAPLPLYARVQTDLERIEDSPYFTQAESTFTFRLSPYPSELSLDLEYGSSARLKAGESTIFDSLNGVYKPTFKWWSDETRESVTLYFPGRLRSELLRDVYRDVPEVIGIGVHVSGYQVGVWRRSLYVGWGTDETIKYIFHSGDGPDNEVVTFDTLYCLTATADSVHYEGSFLFGVEEAPDWWATFCVAIRFGAPPFFGCWN